jgi:hypothetical protein
MLNRNTSGAAIVTFLVSAVLPLSAAVTALPGTINWVEGQVTVDGAAIPAGGPEVARVNLREALETAQGKAEILLTPGVFLRVDERSAIKMSGTLQALRVELLRGDALLEVAQIDRRHSLDVLDHGADARAEKDGIYVFSMGGIYVRSGKLRVADDRRIVTFGKGEELLLDVESGRKPRKADARESDAIYAWSASRAKYVAVASEWSAELVLASLLTLDRTSAHEAAWYWNPWFDSWAFAPAKNYQRSPFGYGYYSPAAMQNTTPVFADSR